MESSLAYCCCRYRCICNECEWRAAMSWSVDQMHTQVESSAKHVGIMTVKGQITGVQAMIDFNEDDFTASSVEATIDARTLSTHDERRDAHLKSADFLDVEQFPTIAFKSTRIEHAAHDQYSMTGDLTIRDVRRPVSLEVVYSGQAKDPMGNTTPASAPIRPSTARTGD